MNAIHAIRKKLGVTQAALASGIGVTQGNVSFYEKGQTVPPHVAERLIEYAATHGVALTFDQIYRPDPAPAQQEASHVG
ncbi:putative zinc finger/helix-turn-helix protein%2C YgiT family [Achromobacter xylosoxidans]|uniref:helix-turn-helix domain-containing protein n=1 Tax=Alcaligenes xylosoxydans xylosoxydans TaxID=85698 RepID=UPI0006C0F304|nr:helix-turn-helix transcriptional regulator [Achromobacter xylosoxidans]CUJ66132.1 putative zinc finger/helix-turn-helix protein%2C YgiT family [Achromobacter xylosoxidans]